MKLIYKDMPLFKEGRIVIGIEELPLTSVKIDIKKNDVVFVVATCCVDAPDFPRVFGNLRYTGDPYDQLLFKTKFKFQDVLCGVRDVSVKEIYHDRAMTPAEIVDHNNAHPEDKPLEFCTIVHLQKIVKIRAIPDMVFWQRLQGKPKVEDVEQIPDIKEFLLPVVGDTNAE